MSENTILDLDALLEGSLDGVEAAPDYLNPPPGLYELAITEAKLEKYKPKDKPKDIVRIKMIYKVLQTTELDPNGSEPPVADGTLFNETFMYNEDGLPYFKKQAQAVLNVKSVDGVSMRELLSALSEATFKAKISERKSSKDGKDYVNTQVRPIHETPAT